MSDYSKITNFLSKDSLALNDPAKYVKGSEIDAEYNAIAVAIATKADTASPTLVTPVLGVATATSINKITFTQPATGATVTILNGKTLTVNHSLALAGTDGTTMTFPSTSATLARIDAANTFIGTQTYSGLGQFNLGLNVAGADFTSRGITDSATAKALTLSGSGANSVTIANSATNPTIGVSAGALNIASALGVGASVPSGIQLSSLAASNGTVGARISNLNAAPGADLLQTAVDVASGTGYYHYRAYSLLSTVPTPVFTVRGDGLTTVGLSTQNTITLTGSNGGNPTIGTSGGALSITPATGALNITGTATNIISPATGSAEITLGNASTGTRGRIVAVNDGNLYISSYGTGAVQLYTGDSLLPQVVVAHTAGADHYITLTGSNGGNPTIGVSGGALAISCATTITNQLNVMAATATPAGGTNSAGVMLGSAAVGMFWGSGAPTMAAAQGSIYLRTDGGASTRIYSNNNGSTGWSAITSA